MKRLASMFSIFPCVMFLSSQSLTPLQVATYYEKIIFEAGSHLIHPAELNVMMEQGRQDPEEFFRFSDAGEAAREPIRQGLKQLRTLVSGNLKDIAPEILKIFERRLAEVHGEKIKREIAISETEQVEDALIKIKKISTFSVPQSAQTKDLVVLVENPNTVSVWSRKEKRFLQSIAARDAAAAYLFGDENHVLVATSEFGPSKLKIYDLAARKWLVLPGEMDFANMYRMSSDGQYLILGRGLKKPYMIWSLKTKRLVHLDADHVTGTDDISNYIWFATGNVVMTYQSGIYSYWNPDSGELIKKIEVPNPFKAPDAISQDGGRWFMKPTSKFGYFFDPLTHTMVGENIPSEANFELSHFSNDASLLISRTIDAIYLKSAADGKVVQTIKSTGASRQFTLASLSANNRYLATIQADKTSGKVLFSIWDAATARPLVDYEYAFHLINGVEFSADSSSLFMMLADELHVLDLDKLINDNMGSKTP